MSAYGEIQAVRIQQLLINKHNRVVEETRQTLIESNDENWGNCLITWRKGETNRQVESRFLGGFRTMFQSWMFFYCGWCDPFHGYGRWSLWGYLPFCPVVTFRAIISFQKVGRCGTHSKNWIRTPVTSLKSRSLNGIWSSEQINRLNWIPALAAALTVSRGAKDHA